jgi:hypothetical protein
MKKLLPLFIVYLSVNGLTHAQCTSYTIPHSEPYNVPANNQLPLCWSATNFSNTTLTYTQGYAAFSASQTNSDYFFSPGFQLVPGVVYSVTIWQKLQSPGNWSDISLLIGSSQSTSGLTNIVSAAPASTVFIPLTNTFTVSAPGTYYLAVMATSSSTSSPELWWNNFMLSIPCTIAANKATVTITPPGFTLCAGSAANYTLNASGADTYTWYNGSNTSSTVIQPGSTTLSTIYSVSGTKTLTGCTSVAVLSITVHPTPNVGVFSIPPSACAGSSAILFANGATGYTWIPIGGNSPVATITPMSTTSYTVIGRNMFGCTGRASITVSVNPKPSISVFAGNDFICAGDPVELVALGGLVYTWTGVTSVASTVTVTPLKTTTYQVTGYDANFCSNTASVTVMVAVCDALQDEESAAFKVFPTPVKDKLQLNGKNFSRVELTDLNGKTILLLEEGNGMDVIDVSGIPAGFYLLKIETSTSSRIVKIMKE